MMTPLVILLCLPVGIAATAAVLLAWERWTKPDRPVSLPRSYTDSLYRDLMEGRQSNPDLLRGHIDGEEQP